MSLRDALTDLLGPARGARAGTMFPEDWDALPPRALVLVTLLDGDASTTVRASRAPSWTASLDPPADHAGERAAVELAALASRQLAHDLQTPLNTATTRIELATDDNPELLAAARTLYELSALQSVRAERFPTACDHIDDDASGMHRIHRALEREFTRHGARWRYAPPEGELLEIGGAALQSALVILGENALDAVKRGATEARASLRAEGALIELRVEDDGPGLDPAAYDRLARPNAQRGFLRASRGLWTLRVISASLEGAVALAPRSPRGVDARLALSSRPLRRASPG